MLQNKETSNVKVTYGKDDSVIIETLDGKPLIVFFESLLEWFADYLEKRELSVTDVSSVSKEECD